MERMTRREMLRILGLAGAGSWIASGGKRLSWAETKSPAVSAWPDLVAVKDGSPAQMFEKGIGFLGGMERFVKKGNLVLVKPNIGWNKTPMEGADTNPELVGKIVASVLKAGAKKVVCFDHSVHVEKDCWERSGIAKAVKENSGEMATAANESDYREVDLPKAKILKKVKVHKLYLDSDVVINVPILKSHGGARITAALKNLMGVVWDRRFWHREGLQEAIGEVALVRKPDLNVVDAYLVMRENGPLGVSTEDLLLKKMQILSTDIVLADAAAIKTMEVDPAAVPYLKTAADLGIGRIDLEKSVIRRVSIAG
jgi:uncharacterized protein (DUF362 family)